MPGDVEISTASARYAMKLTFAVFLIFMIVIRTATITATAAVQIKGMFVIVLDNFYAPKKN